ncbi:MAG: hypothetical protein L6435_08410 [Anaerolineae bacterium]|nr:hypothetical protein [Anaerolineae bacterium]
MVKKIYFAVLCLVLGGCVASPAPNTDAVTAEPTAPCGWVESRQGLPELSEDVQAALEGAGIAGAKAYAEAYGGTAWTPRRAKRGTSPPRRPISTSP